MRPSVGYAGQSSCIRADKQIITLILILITLITFVLSLLQSYAEAGDVSRAVGFTERQSRTLHVECFLRAPLGSEPGGTPRGAEHRAATSHHTYKEQESNIKILADFHTCPLMMERLLFEERISV